MDEKRRLGPQDPLSWIRDTREERLENPAPAQQPSARETFPVETKREIVHTDKSIPMEVKVTLKGQPVKQTQTITLEITVGPK
jgi:hypothetical protein